MNHHTDLVIRMAFASLRGINRVLAGELLSRTGDERTFFDMSERQLASVMGFGSHLFDAGYRGTLLEKAAAESDFVQSSGIRTLYFTDADYPVRLADADDAPLMLFTLGNHDFNSGRTVGIVGTRHATPYGIDFVNRLVSGLSTAMAEPLTTVSGLAFGIDAAAHAASLKAQVPTVGVLAHGLNMIYPAQHRSMAADIVHRGGALITEYGSRSPVHKGNFVARNRIVAALCDCLIVAESAEKGGALITARLASGYNRDVFALPGRTSDPYSAGCNMLIKRNVAALVTDASDVMEAMNWPARQTDGVQRELFVELSAEEQAVSDYLTEHGEAQVNQLAIALNMNAGRMVSLLIDMEFKGLVLAFPGGKYRLA